MLLIKPTIFLLYLHIFKAFWWLKFGIIGGAIIVSEVYAGFLLTSLISQTPRGGQTWLKDFETSCHLIYNRIAVPVSA